MDQWIRDGVKNKKNKINGIFQIEGGGVSEGSISKKTKKQKKRLLLNDLHALKHEINK